ncbi:YidH family protein [Vulcanococcus limneticus]|uniref:YidH family protein n=1 Tax=Vulcanococcus limneticus TaxID=2170428 RepID=UPI00398BD5FF
MTTALPGDSQPTTSAPDSAVMPAESVAGRRTHFNPNRIRDHLANERTYLSWMRSGISLLGFGVLIVRIRWLRPPLAPQGPGNGWKLGLAFSVVGLISVALSAWHYFAVRDDIERDTYEPSDRWVLLSSLVLVVLGACVVVYVFNVPFDVFNVVVVE